MSNPEHYSVTFAEVAKGYRAAEAELKDPIRGKAYLNGIVSQKRSELELLTSYQVCPAGVNPTAVASRLAGLKPETLKAGTKDRFYSGEVMQAAACISSSLYVDQGPYALASNERVRAFITGLRQIGAESVSGYAMVAGLGETEKAPPTEPISGMFVVKAPRNPDDADELVHECMVALYGTNSLRSGEFASPNYAWVYGMFVCSPPFIDGDTKKVATWCSSTLNSPVAYALYENVAPAKSFGDFALQASAQEILRNYIGSMLGLREGVVRLGFTHYDDHDDNELMCERRKGVFYVKVRTNRGTEWMEYKDVIPTKIDYGMSHIQLTTPDGRTQHFGHVSKSGPLTMFGVYRDRANPIHDAYKLLCMMLNRIRGARESGKANMAAYEQLAPLLTFFNLVEPPKTILDSQSATFFALPWNDHIAKLNLDDWIEFLRAYCPRIGMADPVKSAIPTGGVALQCAGDCLTFTQEMKEAGIDLDAPLPTPQTFLEFYDAFGALMVGVDTVSPGVRAPPEVSATAADLMDRFRGQFTSAYNMEDARLMALAADLKPFIVYHLPRTYADLISDSVLNQLKFSVTQTVKFLDAYKRIQLAVKVIQFIAELYGADASHPLSQLGAKYQAVLTSADSFRTSLVEAIQSDMNFLEPWRTIPDASLTTSMQQEDRLAIRAFARAVQERPEYTAYKWYWATYPTVLAMV